jgi:hypothetical protein
MSHKKNIETIILEETRNLLLERQLYTLIEQEAAKLGASLTEEQKKSILQRLKKSAKRYAGPLAMGAALAGGSAGIHGLQSDFESGLRTQAAQNVAAAQELAASPQEIERNLRKQLGNEYAWTWNTTGDKDDKTAFPGVQRQSDRSYAPYGGTGGIDMARVVKKGESVQAVYPPDWSVMQQVFMDFKSGAGPQIMPEDVVPSTGQTDITEFFDSEVWQQGDLKSTGHGAPYRGAKFVSFDSLPDSYQLPLSGKSKSEYYVQLWDKYIGY